MTSRKQRRKGKQGQGKTTAALFSSSPPAASQEELSLNSDQCKQRGNDLYNQCKFDAAERFYTQGLLVCGNVNGGNGTDTSHMRAVLHSNRANAKFENGDYGGAIRDSSDSLQILQQALSSSPEGGAEDVKRSNLIAKSRWRLARALFYIDNDGGVEDEKKMNDSDFMPSLNQLASDCEAADPKLMSKIQSLEEAQQLAMTRFPKNTTCADFTPQLVRHHKRQGLAELFIFGHDEAISALGWEAADNKDQYDVLFGGIGDGRHLMATILDAANNTDKRGVQPKLRMVMNDIHARTLLKTIMALIVSQKVGQFAPNVEAVLKDKEACLLMSVIYYSTMSYAMPAVVLEKFQSLLRETFLESNRTDFVSSYPWFAVNEDDWGALTEAVLLWVDMSLFDPPLPPVLQALCMNNTDDSGISSQVEIECNGWNPVEHGKKEKKKKFDQEIEKFSHIENYSTELLANVRSNIGQNATDSEVIDAMLNHIHNEDVNVNPLDAKNEDAFAQDKHFVSAMGGALLPPALDDVLDPAEAFLLAGEVGQAKRHIRDTWETNPVKFDPDWPISTDHTSYITEWYRFFWTNQVLGSFKSPLSHEEQVKLLYEGTVFEHTAYFYWNLGKSIELLSSSNRLSVEINTDCVIHFCNVVAESNEDRQEAGLSTRFSRVFLSNIPDYTSLPPMALELHAVLEKDATVKTNILMNTGLFKTYDQYLLGSFDLVEDELEKVLGITTIGDKTDLWAMFNTWGFRDIELKSPLEVKAWLHRMFLHAAYPPHRKSRSHCREERPHTIDLFLRACAFCIHTLGYSQHIIMGTIDELLGKELKTKVALSNQSPSVVVPESGMNKYNLSACQLELQNRLSLWIGSGKLPKTLAKLDKLPKGLPVQYKLNLALYPEGDCNCSNALGMLLEKKRDFRFDDPGGMTNMFQSMMSQMMPGGIPSGCGPMPGMICENAALRHALLEKGDVIGHIFSCIAYDSRAGSITFWMMEDTFAQYASYDVSIIRTDGWFRNPFSEHKLMECERI
mmetsp:Transcript_20641/g.44834  ORF Transcript_20641/g.44834 Transcript_20641/m.44834 type:complete len:1017 (+) Transcript_20641:130-3180(+)